MFRLNTCNDFQAGYKTLNKFKLNIRPLIYSRSYIQPDYIYIYIYIYIAETYTVVTCVIKVFNIT